MKIIKEGKLPKKVELVFKGVCYNCGCEVECDDADLLPPSEVVSDAATLVRYGKYVECPTPLCGKEIRVKDSRSCIRTALKRFICVD